VGRILKYRDEIVKSLAMLAAHNKTIFIGQNTLYSGTSIYKTIEDAKIPLDQRIEVPVCEDMQMGMSIGLALEGYVPVSIYPRFDFMILATNQIVNHLDRLHQYSDGEWVPKVIIKVSIGSSRPLHPGYQHCADYTDAFKLMAPTINIVKIEEPEQIFPAYEEAFRREGSSMLVEYGDYYSEK